MIQIAVCDDDIQELECMYQLVEEYLQENPQLDTGVRRFRSSYDLRDGEKLAITRNFVDARPKYMDYLLERGRRK